MKVTVIYDFSVDIECFKRDKAVIKCSYEQFTLIRDALIEAKGILNNKEDYLKLLNELDDYEVKHKD